MEPTSPWKRPNEVMQLHRLKRNKKALQNRMSKPLNTSVTTDNYTQDTAEIDFSRILNGDKRKNPFSKGNTLKKQKSNEDLQLDESSDKTLFALLNLPSKVAEKPPKEIQDDKLSTFSNLLQKYTADHAVEAPQIVERKFNYLPIDWALKTRLRLMSPKPFAWSQTLKASEEASGITGFVRCLDTSSSTLDTSPRARFHQTCLYWQHPHLPWLNLYPRSTGKVAATNFMANNEEVKQALHKEWTESFRSLFQVWRDLKSRCTTKAAKLNRERAQTGNRSITSLPLVEVDRRVVSLVGTEYTIGTNCPDAMPEEELVRARHCPYFYVCANTFTCLFRSGGLCGQTETCALITPTTRGLRQLLRQEDIEFTMPLRPDNKKKLNNSDSKDEEKPKNSSYDSCYDTMDDDKSPTQDDKREDCSGDEDDIDNDEFLSQLGLETDIIKKINNTQMRIQNSTESNVDSAAESLVFIRGADAQALFNFLLNCKSIVSPTGPFAGLPPTLLAPTAFYGGTLQALKVRESTIYSENNKYYSIELRGAILPTAVHSLFQVLKSSSKAQFSATFANQEITKAFCWAAESIAKDEPSTDSQPNHFAKENLSDCGLNDELLQHLCSSDPNLIQALDSIKYNCEDNTYTW